MQVRNDNTRPGDEASRANAQAIDLTRSNRDGIRESVDRARETDKVDLSKAAESAEDHIGTDGANESPSQREARLTSLRTEVQAGTLNTPERIQRAAENLLSD